MPSPGTQKAAYPMRINKYLAQKNHGTRRECDTLIERGKVFINGRLAVLGDKVNENDEVAIRNISGTKKSYRYFAYNKPKGVITHSPQMGEPDIKEETAKFAELAGTFPIGRLDKDSHGLIILTDDGRVTDRLLNPEYDHEKEYIVHTKENVNESFAKRMASGVDIEGYRTKLCKVKILDDRTFSIALTEGKKHQIRRMVVALGNEVTDLERVRIMNIALSGFRPGTYRPIRDEELKTFLTSLKM
jgi:23S rRNA pseudouridine2604 synthase